MSTHNKRKHSSISELEEEKLRDYIRELMFGSDNVKEHDLITKQKKDWTKESDLLKQDMVQLLKHIQDDQYPEGIDKINRVMARLKVWRHKINKFL